MSECTGCGCDVTVMTIIEQDPDGIEEPIIEHWCGYRCLMQYVVPSRKKKWWQIR